MKIKNWTDRITDESDPWFNAIKMEDGGDFLEASMFYLNDAISSTKHSLHSRAALSCLGAAECLVRIGRHTDACRLYLEAASFYEQNADKIIGSSVRESLWSLQESYENFLMASDYTGAQRVFDKYVFLTRKLNPFFGEKDAVELLRSKRQAIENIRKSWNCFSKTEDSNKLSQAIQDLIKQRQNAYTPQASLEELQKIINRKETLT